MYRAWMGIHGWVFIFKALEYCQKHLVREWQLFPINRGSILISIKLVDDRYLYDSRRLL